MNVAILPILGALVVLLTSCVDSLSIAPATTTQPTATVVQPAGSAKSPMPASTAEASTLEASTAEASTPEASTMTEQSINIRVYNASNIDFAQVTIRFPEHKETYGPLLQGTHSEYRPIPIAYRYAHVEISANDANYVFQPIDYVGETPLAPGRYTYRLSVTQGRVVLELSVD